MGRDKALLRIGDKTFAEISAATIKNAFPGRPITFVAASEDQFTFRHAFSLDIPFVFDLYPGRGPVGGLHSALAHARTEWAFVLACDYPLVTPDLIKLLSGFIDDQHGAVIPIQQDGRIQPLCAFYRVKPALAVLENVLTNGRVTPPLHALAENEMTPLFVEYSQFSHLDRSETLFLNVNTPSELNQAEKICKLSP